MQIRIRRQRATGGGWRAGLIGLIAVSALLVIALPASVGPAMAAATAASERLDLRTDLSTPATPAPASSPVASPEPFPTLAGTATTIEALTLRAGSSTDDAVILVIPVAASVTLTGKSQNGYLSVHFRGSIGWAASPYLDKSGGSGQEHWIDVARRAGTVTLHVGKTVQATYRGSMSADRSDDGFFATALGTYRVYAMNADLTYTDYGGVYIRDWVGFDPDRANGFHSYPMDADGAVLPGAAGPSHGCVRFAPADADALYAFASIGMRVVVHW